MWDTEGSHDYVGGYLDNGLDWVSNHAEWVALGLMFLSLCGIVVGVRYLWLSFIRSPLNRLLNKLFQPMRRMHSRWSRVVQREHMAKWRKGHLANAFYECIHREIEAGRLSKQQGKQLQSQMAKFFGLDDLARIKTHVDAIKHRIRLNDEYKWGPKQEHPAWGAEPQPNGPPVEKFGSKFLLKKRVA